MVVFFDKEQKNYSETARVRSMVRTWCHARDRGAAPRKDGVFPLGEFCLHEIGIVIEENYIEVTLISLLLCQNANQPEGFVVTIHGHFLTESTVHGHNAQPGTSCQSIHFLRRE